jgi:hypothetical protein
MYIYRRWTRLDGSPSRGVQLRYQSLGNDLLVVQIEDIYG